MIDAFKVGDIIKITTKNPWENKVHASTFEGVVISYRGKNPDKTLTVRRIATDKVAVERIFPINSPHIESIKVMKHQNVRRAKLY